MEVQSKCGIGFDADFVQHVDVDGVYKDAVPCR